jgi:hypothetical protein
MRAESGENRLQPVAIKLPRVARQIAGALVHATVVGWYDEYTISSSEFRKALYQQIL